MKIKRFNELNDETYRSAASKLSKKGHYKRSVIMNDYVDRRKVREDLAEDEYRISSMLRSERVIKMTSIVEKFNRRVVKNIDDLNIDDYPTFDYIIECNFEDKFNNLNKVFKLMIKVSKFGLWQVETLITPLEFDRVSALKFKRNVIDKILSEYNLSDILMIKETPVEICSKIYDSIDSIKVNDINSSNREIVIFKKRYNDEEWID